MCPLRPPGGSSASRQRQYSRSLVEEGIMKAHVSAQLVRCAIVGALGLSIGGAGGGLGGRADPGAHGGIHAWLPPQGRGSPPLPRPSQGQKKARAISRGQPVYTGVTVAGNVVTVTFNKPVCRVALFNQTTWQVSFNAINDPVFGDTIPICNVAADNGVASASLFVQGPPPVGSLVAVTLTASGHLELRDAAGD